jgi:hypothetical protein
MGTKETQEAINGLLALAAVLAVHLRDGFQAEKDLPALWEEFKNNTELNEKLQAAYEGAGQVPAELEDLSTAEGISLVMGSSEAVLKLVAALRK